MACKKLLLILIMLMLFMPLFAQNSESADIELNENEIEEEEQELNYYLDRSGREPRFIQRLIWEGDEFVLRYVLIVQRRGDDGRFTEAERLETFINSAEVSLTAGNYRYCLEVYDLFDDYSFTTNWHEFVVFRAIQPTVSGFSPNNFYLDEEEEWVITVRGQNFLPETVFMLVQNNSRISPIRADIDGNTARLQFSGASFFPGRFAVYARNPGGLDHSLESFAVANRKRFDVNFTLGYMPIVPLYGYLFQDGFIYDGRSQEAPFPDSIYPLSAGARISFLPIKRTWGNVGVDLSGSYSFLSHDRGFYQTEAYLINGHASLLYQKHFRKRTFFVNANLGGGIFSVYDFGYTFGGTVKSEEKENAQFFSVVGGLSFTYMFKKPFFATMGADLIHAFTPEVDSPMPAVIRPYIGIGLQL